MWLTVVVPVPEIPTTSGELAALLTTVTLPGRLLVAVGANVTLNEVDCPAARVRGSAIPAVLNPVPPRLICEIKTLAFPVFESVTFCVALVPVARLPKFSEVGDAERWRLVAMPVPPSGTSSGELGVLLMSVMLPE